MSRRRGRVIDRSPDWLTVTAYARIYGVSRGVVYKWLRADLLEIFRVGALLRVRNQPPKDAGTVHQRS